MAAKPGLGNSAEGAAGGKRKMPVKQRFKQACRHNAHKSIPR